jgi:hypothetical protein
VLSGCHPKNFLLTYYAVKVVPLVVFLLRQREALISFSVLRISSIVPRGSSINFLTSYILKLPAEFNNLYKKSLYIQETTE